MGRQFQIIMMTPACHPDASLAIAAARAGHIGIYNAEIDAQAERIDAALAALAKYAHRPFGLKLPSLQGKAGKAALGWLGKGLEWIVLDAASALGDPSSIEALQSAGCKLFIEAIEWDERLATFEGHDGLIVKGHESGGRVGEETSFILLQKALARQAKPVYVRGGIGFYSVAAARAAGAAGVVLDNQLLLLRESPVRQSASTYLRDFTGMETGLLYAGDNSLWRMLEKPGYRHVREIRQGAQAQSGDALAQTLRTRIGWQDPTKEIAPIGQDAAFAAAFAERGATVAGAARALIEASEKLVAQAAQSDVLGKGKGVAPVHGTACPIIQGPMTRVSDTAPFAQSVAENGALPMLALALMKGKDVDSLLADVAERLKGKSWGVGLLGFAPADLIAEQIKIARKYNPTFALIAGGRPGQAVEFEADGIKSYLHVPSPTLLSMFLEQGAKRFVFEGRECGGHVGPLASFVLWDLMVTRLMSVRDSAQLKEVCVIFAGGIHDARSAAMVSAMTAPLAERGLHVGVLMGTAYLFTKEIVEGGAIVPAFQEEALACTATVNLETGPGHASRCVVTEFANQFQARKRELEAKGEPKDRIREELEDLTLGRLRVATKAKERQGDAIVDVPVERQRRDGMYMIGEVATLRDEVVTMASLHEEITDGAKRVLQEAASAQAAAPAPAKPARPADIAIIGLGAYLPKAASAGEYWDNILDRVSGIVEIPAHRWDWRIYFDADRQAPDKVYSKWGGFLEDMPFDPMKFGVPPRAIKAIDPLQLMTLEVIAQCLADAGYEGRDFDKSGVSVILGASGGAGDVGAQYAVRSELPRFSGELDEDVAGRLPSWTEDSFAGILLNVAAGRAANRFDFGGINFTVDAACASSLAAIYQGVVELESHRSDLVIAGGVDTVQGPFGYLCFSKTQALSPRGRCSTFNTDADGIVISEGIAMIALKRLEDAERDGDRIYAVIKGVGGSSDGRNKSMTAPHPDGQIRALNRAYEMAGYAPSTVALFEAHGTGTVAGDTAELETVTRLLKGSGAAPRQSAIGSVKTLIGHTKATAGVAGLMKAALSCYHRVLPPHGRVETPNAKFTDPESPVYLVKEPTPWLRQEETPRRAAVSAFGFGGTNFHITLEEYEGDYLGASDTSRDRWPFELLLWRGGDRAAVSSAIKRLMQQLGAGARPLLRDLAKTLADTLPEQGLTAAMVAGTSEDLLKKLESFAAHLDDKSKPLPPGCFFSEEQLLAKGGKLAFIFPGQGTQHIDMQRELALIFPEIRASLECADRVLGDVMAQKGAPGGRLSRAIYPPAAYSEHDQNAAQALLTRTDFAQPALGAVESGLLHVLRRLGIAPDMAAGHSYGEYVALYAAGVLDQESLHRVSEARGRFMVEAGEGGDLGTMIAVQARREDIEKAIAGMSGIVIGNHNAPMQTILSGTRAAVDEAAKKLTAAGINVRQLVVGAAFHSPIVAPARDRLAKFIDTLELKAPAFPVYSNTTAGPYPTASSDMRDLLARQLASPVEFVAEIEAMYGAGARVFLGVGPKLVQANLVRQILEGRPHRAVALSDDNGGLQGFLAGLGTFLAEGGDFCVGKLFENRDARRLDLKSLAADPRKPKLSANTWMLNGSAAYKYGEAPPKPLTLEEIEERKHKSEIAEIKEVPARTENEGAHTAQRRPSPSERTHVNRGIGKMERDDDLHPGDAGPHEIAPAVEYAAWSERSAILAEYQATMRQFLASQESVMLSYLGGSAGQRSWTAMRPALVPAVRPASLPAPAPRAPAKANGHAPNGLNGSVAKANGAAAPAPAPQPVAAKPAPKAGAANGHAAPAPAAALAPAPAAAKAEAKSEGAQLTQQGITSLLLDLVEQRTGYGRDMIDLNQDLEADLGIDSIKRVEIVGALLKALPAAAQEHLADVGETLNKQKTLQGTIDALWQRVTAAREGGARPFDAAGEAGRAVAPARLPRFVIKAEAESADPYTEEPLGAGLYLITDDGTGIAPALADLIAAKGAKARLIDSDTGEIGDIEVSGFIHLAALANKARPVAADLEMRRADIERADKSAYFLLQQMAPRLRDGGRIVLATGLGGLFARGAAPAAGLAVQGGAVGLAKSLKREWPDARFKAVDLDPALSADRNAKILLREMLLPGGRIEVGYPKGARTVFRTIEAPLDPALPARLTPDANWVILATGGARGITAEVLAPFAAMGARLVLVGRSPLRPKEDEILAAARTAALLRPLLVKRAKDAGRPVKPADIEREMRALVQDREMKANIAALEAAGAKVDYKTADVRDPKAMGAILEELYARYSRIDGVVHGAGVIEDKLLIDKPRESWDRVVGTKLDGVFALAAHLKPETLKFFALFTSVAGRYGNSGQTDYAMANEALNRIAWQLHRLWDGKVKVAAMNWGPWLATTHGAGMVSEETRRKFESIGVTLVPPGPGTEFFRDELLRAPLEDVEVVAGGGPWESHESEVGAFGGAAAPVASAAPASRSPKFPLLIGVTSERGPRSTFLFKRTLAVEIDRYLDGHRLDGIPVLPAAVALEIMAEIAAEHWPDWHVSEVRDLRALGGIRLDGNAPREIEISVLGAEHGDAMGFSASLEMRTPGAKRANYRAAIFCAGAEPQEEASSFVLSPARTALSAHEAYRKLLFHGPCFQTIAKIEGLDPSSAVCDMVPTSPGEFVPGAPQGAHFLFDPGLIDAAAQMGLVWSSEVRNAAALPNRFGLVRRLGNGPIGPCRMYFALRPETSETQVRADVAFVDANDMVRLSIEDLECTSNAALNRLCGWAGEIRV